MCFSSTRMVSPTVSKSWCTMRAPVDQFAVGDRHACQFDVLVDDRLHRSVERPDHQLEATESLALEFGEVFTELVASLLDSPTVLPWSERVPRRLLMLSVGRMAPARTRPLPLASPNRMAASRAR